ncbi:MAG: phosphodiester glycosidase family protein [Muribaculaceae bacterium]|jgi:hypothetical protein|nr:phosphodiester glycosidase family protein [Muribaculaceae bacterium]
MKHLMRFSILLAVALLTFHTGNAKNQWTVGSKTFDVDTIVYPHQVGPGTTFAKYNLPDMPLLVSVLTMDLKNKYVDFETCNGGDRGVCEETPVSMYNRKNKPGHEVIGATNGDFYFYTAAIENGIPRSGQFSLDQCVTNPVGRACFVLTDERKPYIDRVDFAGKLSTPDTTVRLHTVNMQRLEWEDIGGNQLTLYTNAYGTQTEACAAGMKAIISPVGEPFSWTANKEVKAVIDTVFDGTGVSQIPEGKATLWGQGTCATFVQNLKKGTPITIYLGTNLRNQPGLLKNFKELMGGSDNIIMRNGIYEDEWADRHPRTCIGFNADSTKVYFVVIDGRNSKSVGVSMEEAAGVFRGLGAANAVNLDGGGSSCMVVNGDVVNTPSDGAVRAVGNGCLLVSNAPVDDAIGMLGFEPRTYNVSILSKLRPAIWGYNKYGVLKTQNLEGVTFTCDPTVGTISSDGYFIAADVSATGNLTAHYGDLSVSQPITVFQAEKSLRLDSVVIDKTHPYGIEVYGVSGLTKDLIDASVFNWASASSDVCTVSDQGTISAVNSGDASVTGTGHGFNGTIKVKVQNPESTVMPLDKNLDVATWKIAQSGGSGLATVASENGIKLTYTGASSRSPYIKIAKSMAMWGLPDTLRLRINPGDATISKIIIATTANNGTLVTSTFTPTLTANAINTIGMPTSSWCDATDFACYPLRFDYIYFTMGKSTTGTNYTIDIPGIELVYNGASGVKKVTTDKSSQIKVFPNPVGEGETVTVTSISEKAAIDVYNSVGQLVKKAGSTSQNGTMTFSTDGLAQGIYLVKISDGTAQKIVKLIRR